MGTQNLNIIRRDPNLPEGLIFWPKHLQMGFWGTLKFSRYSIISITSSSWGRLPLLTNGESTPATDHKNLWWSSSLSMTIIIFRWRWWWEYPRCWSRLCQFGWTLESWQSCSSWWEEGGGGSWSVKKLKPSKTKTDGWETKNKKLKPAKCSVLLLNQFSQFYCKVVRKLYSFFGTACVW